MSRRPRIPPGAGWRRWLSRGHLPLWQMLGLDCEKRSATERAAPGRRIADARSLPVHGELDLGRPSAAEQAECSHGFDEFR